MTDSYKTEAWAYGSQLFATELEAVTAECNDLADQLANILTALIDDPEATATKVDSVIADIKSGGELASLGGRLLAAQQRASSLSS